MEDVASAMQQIELEQAVAKHVLALLQPNNTGGPQSTQISLVQLTICLNASPPSSAVLQELEAALQPIVDLLSSDDPPLQRNACACLTAATSCSERLWSFCVEETTMVLRMVQQLASTVLQDDGLRVNLLALIAAVAQGGEAGALAICSAQGAATVLEVCRGQGSTVVQEAAADAVCSLASYPSCRNVLSKEDAVLALLPLTFVPDSEVRVRALMALGMLLPSNGDNQVALAKAPGAVQQLVDITRLSDDEDCRTIARDLFGILVSNQDAKQHLAAALRLQGAGTGKSAIETV